MRIGLLLGEPSGPDAIDELERRVTAAAADGFATAWLSNVFGLDALTALAAAGRRVPGIELGTGVVPTYPRHPITLAQQALTTDLVLDGRLVLGVGLSHRVVMEDMYGYDFGRPARHMREYLDVLLPLLRGERADVDGETLTAHMELTTPRAGAVPVLLAALGPRMLRLAGEVADGTILWMTGPKTVAGHIVPAITEAARAAGRPSPRVVCALPVAVTGDEAGVRARADQVLSFYGELPSYRAMLDHEGAAGPGDVAIVGDEERVRAQIRALADSGVTDFAAAPLAEGEDAVRTRELLASLAA
ncbi:LLM class F420-dependent oxidoreductase [Sphaerisporangium siamense]|uniref:F420-dependent oxidoreductase-like protein n=1 Tax=Sphaerisporangium siamense TaxID=795645 RepID=A0A7W7GBZ1_9ACTN|nr:TIGR03564 family F420-dependent LLM class oxidoreductase [Sphaerisporangium siamense]MBB4705503.1 F420-dependent oxidoreductase-like protein [Sphaerisporangium siamense]GII83119.1 LLM class F420-dependent oxidoreductase [Sphaerisporangium siamense]